MVLESEMAAGSAGKLCMTGLGSETSVTDKPESDGVAFKLGGVEKHLVSELVSRTKWLHQ